MTNLKILFKNNFNLMLGSFQGKRERKKTSVAIALLALGVIGIYALYFFQAYSMFLAPLPMKESCVFMGLIISLAVLIILGVMRVSGKAKGNDTDFLLSLPIKKRDIIISKTINKYLFDLFFMVVLFSPYIISYQIFTQFSIWISLCGLFAILFMPLLSVGISYILDYVITHLFNRFRSAGFLKSLVSVLIYIVVMALLFLKTFTFGTAGANANFINDRPISYMLLKFIIYQDWPSILGFLALTVLPFVLGMVLYGLSFGKNTVGYTPKSHDLKFKTGKSSFSSLFKKEVNFYMTTPAYIINTIIGPIIILAFSIIISITGLNGISSLLGGELSLAGDFIAFVIALVFAGATALTTISCCSISLEGKNMWILLSSPVNEKTLFMSKALLNIVLVSPFILISSTILTLALHLSFLNFCLMCFLPMLLNVLLSFAGLYINLLLPKLDWNEETQVVKQSIAVLITMCLGVFLTAIPIALMVIFTNLALATIVCITFVVYGLALMIVIPLLFTSGVKLFRKINC